MSIKHSTDVEAKNVAAGKDTTIQVLISSQEGPNFALRKFSMQKGGGMPRHTNTLEHEQYALRHQPLMGEEARERRALVLQRLRHVGAGEGEQDEGRSDDHHR